MRISSDLTVLFLLAIALSLPALHCQEGEIFSPGFDAGGSGAVQVDQGIGYPADQPFQIWGEEEHKELEQAQGGAGIFKGPELWQIMPEAGKDQGLTNLPLLSLAIEPLSGFAPLPVGFRVFGAEQIPYARWELDMEGDSTFEVTDYGPPVTQATYYAPGTYFPKFLFYDNSGQAVAYAQGRVDVQGLSGIPMGAISDQLQGRISGQGQVSNAMGSILNISHGSDFASPLSPAPKIDYFTAPSSAKPGENVTLSWKVLNAPCGVSLDKRLFNAIDSYTYAVPMQGAPDFYRHQLLVFGEPCSNPVPQIGDEKTIRIEKVPNAPTGFEFTGWTEEGDRYIANFKWKDNSNNEAGFYIYRGTEYMGFTPANITTISIMPEISCGVSFIYHVSAYNANGKSPPSNPVTVEDICPPAKRIFDFKVEPGQSSDEYKFNVFCPGPITAKATWTGTAEDLDLTLEGPRNYGRHAIGHSPVSLSYLVDDPRKGYGWKIYVENHYSEGSAKGTIALTYPEGCI